MKITDLVMTKNSAQIRRIEVTLKSNIRDSGHADPVGGRILSELDQDLKKKIEAVRCVTVYYLQGISAQDARKAAEELLCDPVEEDFQVDGDVVEGADPDRVVEICKKPGVMEPVEGSIRKGFKDIGIPVSHIRLSRCYYFTGAVSPDEQIGRAHV